MKRLYLTSLAALLLAAVTAACSQNANVPVSITSSESLVAGCQKLGDVAAGSASTDVDVRAELSDAARAKGGNYVVVPAEGSRAGVAYRCGMPSVAAVR